MTLLKNPSLINKLLLIGYSPENSVYLSGKIKITNIIAIFLFFSGVFFSVVGAAFIPYVTSASIIGSLVGPVAIYLNYKKAYNLSRFLIAIVPTSIAAFFHAIHIIEGHVLITSILICQFSFLLYPWILSDIREKKLLFSTIILTSLIFISQKWLNQLVPIEYKTPIYYIPAIEIVAYIFTTVVVIVAMVTFQTRIYISETKLIEANKNAEKALEDLKQAQSQLIQNEKMASLGLLTSGVAHEINNPLNFIQGGIYALQPLIENNYETQSKGTQIIKMMQEGVDKASAIVKSLNRLYHEEEEVSQIANINDILDSCLTILGHEWKGKCRIVKNYRPEGILYEGSVKKLHEIFTNILLNSMEAIEDYGTITVTTEIGRDKNKFKVSIQDNGCGIKRENLPLVFDPFFTTKSEAGGTGLGLSNVYRYIKKTHGDVFCSSEEEKGTTFTIILPIPQNIVKNEESPVHR